MEDTILKWVLIVACVGSGMMAGLFCAFSSFMMKALGSLSDTSGIQAMQAINRFIVRPSFLFVFMGTGVLCVISVWLGWQVMDIRPLLIASALVYNLGCLVSTVVFNVPLNDQLEDADAESEEGRALWAHYLSRWTQWNHVRSVATLVSTLLLVMALVGLR